LGAVLGRVWAAALAQDLERESGQASVELRALAQDSEWAQGLVEASGARLGKEWAEVPAREWAAEWALPLARERAPSSGLEPALELARELALARVEASAREWAMALVRA